VARPFSQRHLAHFTNSPTERGQPFPLSSLKNKVVLVVNTASKCGFTPQFAGLEALYKDLKKQYPNDIEIIGFPCNQFGGQDPGSNDDIQEFCQINYGVSFPVLGKIDVCIPSTAPAGLLSAATAE
jgi:glutathione peroxidase-family protein